MSVFFVAPIVVSGTIATTLDMEYSKVAVNELHLPGGELRYNRE
jgi:hypothetical protein